MLERSESRCIDKNAVVACPAVNFVPRRAYLGCPDCRYYDGLCVLGKEGNWSQRYGIRCNHPIERRTQHFDVLEG